MADARPGRATERSNAMAYPKNSKSALLALVTAGGLWAWQNRDKVSAWASQMSTQINSRNGQPSYRKVTADQQHAPAVEAYTGNTQRIGDEANEI
jgi:hypothetical protein